MNSVIKKGGVQIGTTFTADLLTRIAYGSNIIGYFGSDGTKVLNTENKIGSGEITIDGKALNHAGEFIDADVSVTNAPRLYFWAKYNCNATKKWDEIYKGEFSSAMSAGKYLMLTPMGELSNYISVENQNISWKDCLSFGSGTGRSVADYKDSYYFGANTDSIRILSSASEKGNTSCYGKVTSVSVFLWATIKCKVYQVSNVRYEYSQGSYVGVVTSNDINFYPNNARHSDGYWYIRIGNSEAYDDYTYANNCISTGTQYIKTGVIGDDSKTYRVFYDTMITHPSSRGLQGFGGSSVEYWGVNNGKYESSTVITSKAAGGRDLVEWVYSPTSQVLKVNGTQICSKGRSSIAGKELQLFAIGGSYLMTQKLYGCVVFVDDVLVRYFVPALRHSDNALGFRDEVNGDFYANAGSGVFT